MLLPCEDNGLRQAALGRKSARIGRFDHLPIDIDQALTALIEHEISVQKDSEFYKQALAAQCDFGASAAFDAIDVCKTGFISSDNLRTFCAA